MKMMMTTTMNTNGKTTSISGCTLSLSVLAVVSAALCGGPLAAAFPNNGRRQATMIALPLHRPTPLAEPMFADYDDGTVTALEGLMDSDPQPVKRNMRNALVRFGRSTGMRNALVRFGKRTTTLNDGDGGDKRNGAPQPFDRKKDLIKLAHGEYISLGRVETNLLTNPHVDNICVYGHADCNYLIALVVPNQKNLEALAEKIGVRGKTWDELCRDSTVVRALTKDLQDHASGKLNKSEIPQRLVLCPEPWTPASGFLTESLKLKRKAIEKQFKEEINKVMKK